MSVHLMTDYILSYKTTLSIPFDGMIRLLSPPQRTGCNLSRHIRIEVELLATFKPTTMNVSLYGSRCSELIT